MIHKEAVIIGSCGVIERGDLIICIVKRQNILKRLFEAFHFHYAAKPIKRTIVDDALWEIVPEAGDIEIEGLHLKEGYLDPEKRKDVAQEASQWVLVASIEEHEELYWHDNDEFHRTWENEREDFYKQEAIIKDGHFFGALLRSDYHWNMGMTSYRDQEYGFLGIDGSRLGRLDDYESRSSDESSYSKKTTYYLRRKQ